MAGDSTIKRDEETEGQFLNELLLHLSEVEPYVAVVSDIAGIRNNYQDFVFGFSIVTPEDIAERVDIIVEQMQRILLPTATVHISVVCTKDPELNMTLGTVQFKSSDVRPT